MKLSTWHHLGQAMRKESLENSVPEKATTAINAAHLLHPANHFGHPRDVLADEIGIDENARLSGLPARSCSSRTMSGP